VVHPLVESLWAGVSRKIVFLGGHGFGGRFEKLPDVIEVAVNRGRLRVFCAQSDPIAKQQHTRILAFMVRFLLQPYQFSTGNQTTQNHKLLTSTPHITAELVSLRGSKKKA
jgi:hypothetical protein